MLWHVSNVYEHKVRVMADDAFPEDWPPEWEWGDGEEPRLPELGRTHLFEEFSRHEIDEETATFGADTTIMFWARRMACEIAIHRLDGEQAHGDPTPIPDDIALDGIDEMLHVMLAGDWWAERVQTEHPVDALVAVEAGGHRWICDVREKSVTIRPGDARASGGDDLGLSRGGLQLAVGTGRDDAAVGRSRRRTTVVVEFRDRRSSSALNERRRAERVASRHASPLPPAHHPGCVGAAAGHRRRGGAAMSERVESRPGCRRA